MKKIALSCILAGILLTAFLVLSSSASTSSTCFDANLMPEEALDDNTEEIDDSIFSSEIEREIVIFLGSPYGSALLAASEGDMGSIPGLESPKGDKSLNEIRFDGWTKDDFFNCNDYLRAFRRYMDTWLQGKKMDDMEADPSPLEPYRERLRGKFLAIQVEEFSFGGLQYRLMPIDDALLVLRVWIYSIVEDDGHISEYLVEHVEVENDIKEAMSERGITKDMARQILLDNFVGELW